MVSSFPMKSLSSNNPSFVYRWYWIGSPSVAISFFKMVAAITSILQCRRWKTGESTPELLGICPVNQFHSSDQTILQADLYTMGVRGRFRQDILDNTFGKFPGSLILLQDYRYFQTGLNVCASGSVAHPSPFSSGTATVSPFYSEKIVWAFNWEI